MSVLDLILKSEMPEVFPDSFDRNDKVLVAKIMMLKNYQTIPSGSHLLYRYTAFGQKTSKDRGMQPVEKCSSMQLESK
jgi:hypothetical protein